MVKTDSRRGRTVLMISHCAGMVDMVALPVWVGTLISAYGFDPQQAGGLVTLFLLGAVIASMLLAPRFTLINGRVAATAGFSGAALAFFCASLTHSFGPLAALHALAGLSAGVGLSVTHGTIGRSANPHRLFGWVGTALGVFAIIFLGATPQLVTALGGSVLFQVIGAVMVVAATSAILAFPAPDAESELSKTYRQSGHGLPRAVWLGILGVSCMALVQALMFSFVERIGADRGFGVDKVTSVLIALGIVNMFPAALAAILDKRLKTSTVVLVGPVAQAALALLITQGEGFAHYAVGSALLVAVMIFTHTFAFGMLAKLDVTGRAVAATPAMLMIGGAIGPILGGTLVKAMGYGGLGLAAVLVDALAVWFFLRTVQAARATN